MYRVCSHCRHETHQATTPLFGEGLEGRQPSQAPGPAPTRQCRPDQRHQRIDVESLETSPARHAGHRGPIAAA